jgi:hypothetical protein
MNYKKLDTLVDLRRVLGHPQLLPQMHTVRSPTSSSSQRTSS